MKNLRDYVRNRGNTPQSEPIPGASQVPNSAGGYAWAVDDWTRLHRFLVLGSEGGSYYAKEQALTAENANAVLRCIKEDGARAVRTIAQISKDGRARPSPHTNYENFGRSGRSMGRRGCCEKSKSFRRSPRIFRLSLTVGRGSGRPSVFGLSRWPCRKSSSMNFR